MSSNEPCITTMEGTLIELDVRTRGEWRRWLARHHASSPGVWLIRHKLHRGVTSMPYEDLVREALCFGWIDSLIKRLDESRYTIKVTRRQPTSKWSRAQPETLEGASGRRPACGTRPRGGSHCESLCAKAEGSRAPGVPRRGIQDRPQGLDILSDAFGQESA